MDKLKVLILLPDGISLKNFAYSNFYKKALKSGFEACFWNATPFELGDLGFNEVKLPKPKLYKLTDVYKTARKHIELNIYRKKFSNTAFSTYKFPFNYSTPKKAFKSALCRALIFFNNSEKGLLKIRTKIIQFERKTLYYKQCSDCLKANKPSILFCTNQRPVIAIAPITAAKDLGIPTATFIFSWDNLPKATMVVETDYYIVWSDYMKDELLRYYPYIEEDKVYVTGTPQFESIFGEHITPKDAFFEQYKLDHSKKYICYSGDDVTTSPDDPQYLEDTAKALRELNTRGHNLGLIFRRCPVDFSNRYDAVLENFKEVITPINPKWTKLNEQWDTILPKKEDLHLLKETVLHSEMVINLGSTMVFDYVIENKPCAYINYDVANKKLQDWSVKKIYKYLHFESMPTKDCVVWLDNPKEIAQKLEQALTNNEDHIKAASDWFKIINQHPVDEASNNIVLAIKDIIKR
ncbi:UDP-glycosyltransferase [Flavivirga eckloniae]|uniref:UDP-glycosyltransferase n=1 Tax=Flavivirga eckloniae TaxID=1803846 RepID=A0A2K9PM94_9FLAO|nr:UDP-glycosyltransferase [Flavivirga eckloniae]AUP78170.1 UDP-glycosyltransferase [Flavivirga eckloniae]